MADTALLSLVTPLSRTFYVHKLGVPICKKKISQPDYQTEKKEQAPRHKTQKRDDSNGKNKKKKKKIKIKLESQWASNAASTDASTARHPSTQTMHY
jgi:hypothetical protein